MRRFKNFSIGCGRDSCLILFIILFSNILYSNVLQGQIMRDSSVVMSVQTRMGGVPYATELKFRDIAGMPQWSQSEKPQVDFWEATQIAKDAGKLCFPTLTLEPKKIGLERIPLNNRWIYVVQFHASGDGKDGLLVFFVDLNKNVIAPTIAK